LKPIDLVLDRIAALRAAGNGPAEIAAELYGVRNAIAHGRSGPLVHDFGSSIEAVGADLPIVKLLSRLVVDK
jgi:hypothetical protein